MVDLADLECVILAGGLATRMRPHTELMPKALLPVGGEPFAAHQLHWLDAQGVRKVVYCVGHLGDQIRAFVGNGSRWGLEVTYIDEGDNLRGTAGAVRLALDEGGVAGGAFLLTYGDSLLDIDVRSVVRQFSTAGLPALMVVIENDGRLGRSNAQYEKGEVIRYDKSPGPDAASGLRYVDYGLSMFTATVIRELVPTGTRSELADVQSRLAEDRRMAGVVAERPYREIGSPDGWHDLDAHLSRTAELDQ